MISAIFACNLRKAIISILTEHATPLRRSLNRADAEKELRARWSRAFVNDHRDTLRNSLKFVQEVARFVTSRFFGEKKNLLSGYKKALNLAKLATLCASLQQHTHFQRYTHLQEYLDHGQSEGGVRPSLSLIGLDHDMSLMCVCCWTTGRLSVSETFFCLKRHRCDLGFLLVAPLRNLVAL